jgi:hypothetical protein
VVLINQKVNASIIVINHLSNLFKVTYLQMLHLLPIIGWECSNFAIGFKDDGSLLLVDLREDVSLGNQFRSLLDDWALLHFELLLHDTHVKRFILVLALNHKDFKRTLLHLFEKSVLQTARLELVKLAEDFHLADVVKSFLPFALMKVSSSKNNVVSTVLGDKLDAFHVVLLN